MEYKILMKKIYFIVFSAIVIGFTVGVMYELNRKNATPGELLNKLPAFFENILSPTTTTFEAPKPKKDWTADLVVARHNKITEVKQQIKEFIKEKDRKKKKNLCAEIGKNLKFLKLSEKNMKIANEEVKKEHREELRKLVKEVQEKRCNWRKMEKVEKPSLPAAKEKDKKVEKKESQPKK
jgi:hypothetical protein